MAPMEVAGTLSKKFRKGIFFYFIFSLKIYLPKTFLLFFFTLISAPTNHTVLLAMPPRPYHCAMLGAVLLLALAVIAPHTVQGTSYNVHQFLDKRCFFAICLPRDVPRRKILQDRPLVWNNVSTQVTLLGLLRHTKHHGRQVHECQRGRSTSEERDAAFWFWKA